MRFVLDASAAGSLILPDEQSEAVNKIVASLSAEDEILVPSLWWFEVANVLYHSYRRGRITVHQLSEAQHLLSKIPISTDSSSGWAYQTRLVAMARDYSLTAYDAAYLELGSRLQAKIICRDTALLLACKKARVPSFRL